MSTSMKVMVVDDEPSVLTLVKSFVESLGVEVLTLADSREAAKRLEREKFDGFLVDVRMPYIDGFELSKRVRASLLNAPAPIVMLTAYNDIETMRQGFKAGVTFFLGKPFTREQAYCLINAMRAAALIEKRRHARLPFRARVTCRCGEKRFESNSVNIGEGGMKLEISGGADEGQQLELEFMIPQVPTPLKLHGTVLRKDPPDYIAVRFLTLSPEQRDAIRVYIEGRLKE